MSSPRKTQPTFVPRLRFPEFRGQPRWDTEELHKIADRVTTKNTDGSVTRVLTNSAEHGVLDQRKFFDKDIATAGKVDGYYIVERGDFVYNPRVSSLAPVGPISRNNVGTGVMSPLYTVFRFSGPDTDFYEHYFNSASWHAYIRSVSSTGARHDRMSLTIDSFMGMPVPCPHPDEQRKIAQCLGTLDDLIAAEGRKLETLRDHKKGLMQQLFPRKDETQPRLRFPEFRDAGEWDEHEFYSILELVIDFRGRTPKKLGMEWGKGGIVSLSANNVRNGYIDFTAECNLGSGPLYQKWMGETEVRKDDIIFTMEAPLGNALLIPDSSKYILSQRVVAFRPNKRITSQFLLQLIWSPGFRASINELSTGSTAKGISQKALQSLLVRIPEDNREQGAIADCLSSLDEHIAAQTAKLDALWTHKRGLLQQLFPLPEAKDGDD